MQFIKKVSISILVMFAIGFLLQVMVVKSVQAANIVEVENDLESVENYGSTTDGFHSIMGVGTLTEYQMINQLIDKNPNLSKTYVVNFISTLTNEAKIEGVNHDILYGLMMLETGFLKFGGDVKPEQNNFGGLGTDGKIIIVDGEEIKNPGNKFPNVQIGIRAVTQHLKGYASSEVLKQACVDERYHYINPKGCIQYVEYLGIQENPEHKGWATAANYGTSILKLISSTRQYPEAWGKATVQFFEVSGDVVVGSKLSISAQGLLDKETLYRIWVCDRNSGKWIMLSNWSTTKTADFTPSKVGKYTFVVYVKHVSKTGDIEDDYQVIDKTVTLPKAKLKSFFVNGENIVQSKQSITAEATVDVDTLYRIWMCDRGTGKWTMLSGWSSKKTVEFTPSKAGKYTFVVYVKHKTKSGDIEDDYSSIEKTITLPKSQVKSFGVTGNEFVGSKLSITADATPDTDTLYRVWMCDRSTGKWTMLSGWSSTKIVEFTPSKSGRYTFVVYVKYKTKSGDIEDDYSSTDKVITGPKSQAKSFEVTGDGFVGSKLNISAEAAPEADTLYRIWMCDRSTGKWTMLSSWSSIKTVEFTPTKAGKYTFVVYVKHKTKSGDIEDDYSSIDKNIQAAQSKLKSFQVLGNSFTGTKLSITAEATPDANTLYRIYVCDRSTGKWTMLSGWSSTKIAEFTPSKIGRYTFVVYVKYKTKAGNAEDDYSSIDRNIELPNSKLTSITVIGETKPGSTLTIKSSATPAEDTLYQIWVCNRNDGKWIKLSDYSKNNVAQYTTTTQGLYRFVIYVKHISKSGDVYDDYIAKDILVGGTKLIIIDPGHGGTDPGALGSNYKEKDLNLDLAYEVKQELINKGYVVLMTRTNDATVSLASRPEFANSYGANFLISIHHNSFNTTTSGIEVLYTSGTGNVDTSRKIATEMSSNIASNIGLYNRGGKDQDLCVCREANMPAVLVEAGFISNPTEEAYVSQNSIQQKIAKSIANIVYKYI